MVEQVSSILSNVGPKGKKRSLDLSGITDGFLSLAAIISHQGGFLYIYCLFIRAIFQSSVSFSSTIRPHYPIVDLLLINLIELSESLEENASLELIVCSLLRAASLAPPQCMPPTLTDIVLASLHKDGMEFDLAKALLLCGGLHCFSMSCCAYHHQTLIVLACAVNNCRVHSCSLSSITFPWLMHSLNKRELARACSCSYL
jgi:hypothetical protein